MKLSPRGARGAEAVTEKPIRAEIVSLTSLRGFLATWIVVYHFWNDVLRLFPWAELLSPIVQVGHMAVPAFFMLSGFVLTYNYAHDFQRLNAATAIRFLGLRLARIYPVHLATLLVVFTMVWVSSRLGYQLTDTGYTTRDFVRNLFLIHTWVGDFQLNWNYPSWSISSEWFAYLLFPFVASGLLRWLTTSSRAIVFCIVMLCSSIATMLYWRPWPFYELILVVPTFLVGAAICQVFRNRPERRVALVSRFLPEMLVLVIGISCFLMSPAIVTTLLLCGFCGLIMSLVWVGRVHIMWSMRPAVFLGNVSYSLYMSHTLAQKLLYRLLPSSRFEASEAVTKIGVLLVYCGLVIVCCLVTYYMVESPCRQILKKGLTAKMIHN